MKQVRLIPAHELPAPSGNDPVRLQALLDNAIEQYMLAVGADGKLPYFEYIEAVKIQMRETFLKGNNNES
jgi:hypothetical protein